MKKSLLLVAATTLALGVSCAPKGPIPEAVVDLAFASSDGEVSWSASKDATEYGYAVNEVDLGTTKETSLNIFDVVMDPSATSLKVWALHGKAKSEAATLSFKTFKLATPNKAVVASDPKTNDYMLRWDEVENANKYLVSVNGGKQVTYHTNSFKPSAKGTFSIEVQAKRYVDKKNSAVYLASEISEKSETLSYLPGPALRNEEINVISWSSEEEFDSYNLWVDGKKIRENVVSPMNLVTGENPVLTKTGEYNIQVEAIKNGTSYWSNVQEAFGTSNINPGEIYSFDNRVFNKNIPSGVDAGWTITSDQAHSAPYSMYVPTQLQVNMQKYASNDINDVDYRRINKISYWVYIPKIEGYSGSVQGVNLPPIVFDGWGEDAAHGRLVSFPKETLQDIPYETWTELHYEVENQYDNVVIFGKGATIMLDDGVTEVSVPFYMDDITYDDIDSVDYDYKFKYDMDLCGGSWSNQPQKLSFGKEFANQDVEISMDVCGTAAKAGTHEIGFGHYDEKHNLTGMHFALDRAKISSLEYQKITFPAKLDENGDFFTTLFEINPTPEDNETVIVYAKNVTCNLDKFASGTRVESFDNGNGTYVSLLTIPTELEAGTNVEVSLDIGIRASTKWSHLKTAIGTWPTKPYPNHRDQDVVVNKDLGQYADWKNLTFSTKVLNEKKINFHNGKDGHTHEFEGNYILLYFWGHTNTDAFYYKPETLKVSALNSLIPAGGETNGSPYHQSLAVIPSELELGTSVEVEFDALLTGKFDAASQIYWIDKVYTAEGGEANADDTRIEKLFDYSNTGWQHIKFAANIRDFQALRVYVGYPVYDTSKMGKGVYLLSMNPSVDSFTFKNAVITAK